MPKVVLDIKIFWTLSIIYSIPVAPRVSALWKAGSEVELSYFIRSTPTTRCHSTMYLVHYIWVFTESRYTLRPRRIAITAELWLFAGVQERDGAYGLSSANPDCQTSPRTGSCAHRSSQTEGICLRHNARMSFGTSPSDPWKWKLSNGVGVTEFRSKKIFQFLYCRFPPKIIHKKIYNIIV